MKQITFITVGELKENSIIQDNVGEKILHQNILEFQELELEPLIGKNLYRRLSNTLVSGATKTDFVMSDDDIELLRYIKPYMIYGTLLNSLNSLHYKVTNKGVQKLIDDSSQTGDNRDIDALRSSYSNKKDGYKKRLIDYMDMDNADDTNVSNAASVDTSFGFTGVYISDNTINVDSGYKNLAYKSGY